MRVVNGQLVVNMSSSTPWSATYTEPWETIALTHAFVAVLLSEEPGPLTAVQRDFLQTIAARVDRLTASVGVRSLAATALPADLPPLLE